MPLELDDHMVRDIGITRAEYQFLLVSSSPPSAPRAGGGEHLLTPTPGERRSGPFRTFEPPRWWFWCNVPLPPAFTFGAGTPEHLASPVITA